MNTLTAIRTFAAPGFSPARSVKLFNNRWYLVRMQNVERGQGDYVGLGEGEYVELLPGNMARERRDAHLNHCNSIAEYDGPVFEAFANQYGGDVRSIGYFVSTQAAFEAVTKRKNQHDKWLADCAREGERYLQTAANVENGTGKSIMSAELLRKSADDCARVIREHMNSFKCNITAAMREVGR